MGIYLSAEASFSPPGTRYENNKLLLFSVCVRVCTHVCVQISDCGVKKLQESMHVVILQEQNL